MDTIRKMTSRRSSRDSIVTSRNDDVSSEADDEESIGTVNEAVVDEKADKSFNLLDEIDQFRKKITNSASNNKQVAEVNEGKYPVPSYKTKNNLKSVLIQSTKTEVLNVNDKYNRKRRYDAAGKYRIGPSFITKSRLAYVDEHKPAKLSVIPDPHSKSLEFGLLTYMWTFTDQHDKQEIDLSFLQSLVDSGVNINCRDEHGQTILHAIVRDWHTDVVLFAIRNNADVNAQDNLGRSPLHLAAALNGAETTRLLLLNGAKVDVQTKNTNQTPIHYAAKFNSLETMKMLIRFQASITQRDGKNKTVLFLAAESGSIETAKFLLDIGAPAGVYDSEGNSLIGHLLEKMPHVANRALYQLIITNMSSKRSEMYLSYLESNTKGKAAMVSKSPLEIITIYEDINLIMHPVIQKAIEVKWNLFGRNDTLRKLFITFLYLTCWLILASTFSDSKEREYYKPYDKYAWKIVPEALIIIFASYFFYKDFAVKKDAIKYHRAWVEWRQHLVRSNYLNCHPAWPGDRENLESETERIRSVPSLAGREKFWFAYEWIMLIILAAIIITRVLDMLLDETGMFIAHKCVFGLGMLVSFARVLKICIRFRYFAVFLKIASLAITSFIQITFLYLQLFVPFVAAFWLMFGDSNGQGKIDRVLVNSSNTTSFNIGSTFINIDTFQTLNDLDTIIYTVYESSLGQELLYEYALIEKITGQILIALFHVFGTFILFAVFVALITSKFTTNFRQCVAEASLLQASVVLQLEKNLSKRDKTKLASYYKKSCNPLVVTSENIEEYHKLDNALSNLHIAERRLTGIENVVHEIEEKYHQNDRRSQMSILESVLNTTGSVEGKQDAFGKGLKTGLKEIYQKQEYMNRYLPKLLKPPSTS